MKIELDGARLLMTAARQGLRTGTLLHGGGLG